MTLYPALEKLLELHKQMGSHSHGDESPDEIQARYKAWVNACYEAMPELRALLADVREREAVADAIHSCAVELIREMYEADGVCFGPDLKDEEFDAAQDIAYAEKIIAKHLGYSSPPSQQAVDVEGAAREIFGEQAEQASTTATQLSPERIAAIIRKHLK